jgi:small redox-active disulfide protein 2
MTTIKVLGSGCAKCNALFETTQKIATNLEIEFEIEKITDMMQFMDYGVMITPALVVNGKLKIAGKIPTEDQVRGFLTE